jgi:hypothetical protein
MDESKRLAVQFLEKEIKTYIALALFLSKEGIKERVQVGDKKVVISSTYYKERMREARKLVNELRKPRWHGANGAAQEHPQTSFGDIQRSQLQF